MNTRSRRAPFRRDNLGVLKRSAFHGNSQKVRSQLSFVVRPKQTGFERNVTPCKAKMGSGLAAPHGSSERIDSTSFSVISNGISHASIASEDWSETDENARSQAAENAI